MRLSFGELHPVLSWQLLGGREKYPSRLLRIVCGFAAGGGAAKAQADAGTLRILFSFDPPGDLGLDWLIP